MVPMTTAKLDMEKLVSLCRRRGFIFQSSEIYGGINGFWDYGPLGVELKKNIKDAWWQDMVRNPPAGPNGQEITMVGLDCSIIMNPKVWEASGHVGGFSDLMMDCANCKRRFRMDKIRLVVFYDHRLSHEQIVAAEEKRRGAKIDGEEVISVINAAGPYPPRVAIAFEADSDEDADKAVNLSKSDAKSFRGEPDKKVYNLIGARSLFLPERRCPACQADALSDPRPFNLMFETYVGAVQDAANIAYLRPETAQGIFVNFKNVLD